jgi:hypothetical protein
MWDEIVRSRASRGIPQRFYLSEAYRPRLIETALKLGLRSFR